MTPPTDSPLAVVTGASSGIGFELAKQFAEHGFDLVVAAEDAELQPAAEALADLGATVQAVQVDLSTSEGVEALAGELQAAGRPVDALALNAGIGAGGGFATQTDQTDLDQELELIDLNVRSTVHLAKRVLPSMVERGEGRVLFTSSIAATMPGAYQAVYNASKSFVQSFAEGIREELKDTGVSVTSLMPGPTDTEFFDRANLEGTRVAENDAMQDDAAKVAKQGFEGLMDGKEQVVAGSLMNKVQVRTGRFVPDALKAKAHEQIAKPGTGE